MNILILSRYQNKVSRGGETVVLELSKRLSKNHKVVVMADAEADNFLDLIKPGEFDVVMPMNGRMQSLKASLGRFNKKYKLVIGGHSGIGKDDIFNIAICKPDLFIALTDYMADWAKKWAWGSSVLKIPNGVDLEKFSPKGEKINLGFTGPVVLSVGALTWYKYHDRAINAVANLKDVNLLIVGDGEERLKLEKLGTEKLGDRFKIVKFAYVDLPKVYRSVDLFTLPSWDREAFGVVYLEAMASGLGVVAPDDKPRREIIGNAGILTNTADEKEYAKAINLALEQKWTEIAVTQSSKYDWDIVVNMYEEAFEKLISK